MWKTDGAFERKIEHEGVYELCFDNSFSRFASKLVYLYMVAYIEADWEKYQKELESLEGAADNFTARIAHVDSQITDMLWHQGMSRQSAMADWYTIESNNALIQNWSILQISVIVVTYGVQVYFVRRLFATTNVTPTSKPRA